MSDPMDNVYFGTYKLTDETKLAKCLATAFNAGYRKFDCAELYKNQHLIGNFVRRVGRINIWLTSKVSFRTIPKGEAKIRESIEKTIKDLNAYYIDLMLIHAPNERDMENDLLTWKILNEYKHKGLIINIGISNYNLENLQEFIESIPNPEDIYCNQIEFNPFLNRKDLIDYCKMKNIKIIAYGNLYYTNDYIDNLALRMKKTKQQILAKYAIQKGFDVILMAEDPEHIWGNSGLDFNISESDMAIMETFNDGRSMYKRYL